MLTAQQVHMVGDDEIHFIIRNYIQLSVNSKTLKLTADSAFYVLYISS